MAYREGEGAGAALLLQDSSPEALPAGSAQLCCLGELQGLLSQVLLPARGSASSLSGPALLPTTGGEGWVRGEVISPSLTTLYGS